MSTRRARGGKLRQALCHSVWAPSPGAGPPRPGAVTDGLTGIHRGAFVAIRGHTDRLASGLPPDIGRHHRHGCASIPQTPPASGPVPRSVLPVAARAGVRSGPRAGQPPPQALRRQHVHCLGSRATDGRVRQRSVQARLGHVRKRPQGRSCLPSAGAPAPYGRTSGKQNPHSQPKVKARPGGPGLNGRFSRRDHYRLPGLPSRAKAPGAQAAAAGPPFPAL